MQRITDSGFAEITVHASEAQYALEMMKNRIRRLSHLEKAEPDTFSDIARLARLCYVLSSSPREDDVRLTRMSLEDVESMYVLPHGTSTEKLLVSLNAVRTSGVRSTGPLDLDVCDQAVKSVFEVMGT